MSYSIPFRISIIIESLILMQNMSPSFDRIKSTQTQKTFPKEESQSIFTDRGMVYNGLSSSSI